jgi:hypothetical protein
MSSILVEACLVRTTRHAVARPDVSRRVWATNSQSAHRCSCIVRAQDTSAAEADTERPPDSHAHLLDERYRRWDMAVVHAHRARRAFVEAIQPGLAGMDVLGAALAISAEDDAIGATFVCDLTASIPASRGIALCRVFPCCLTRHCAGAASRR